MINIVIMLFVWVFAGSSIFAYVYYFWIGGVLSVLGISFALLSICKAGKHPKSSCIALALNAIPLIWLWSIFHRPFYGSGP